MNMKNWLMKSRYWYNYKKSKAYKEYIRKLKGSKNEPYFILVNLGEADEDYCYVKICISELQQERELTERQKKILKYIENEASNSKTFLGKPIMKDSKYKLTLKLLKKIEKELSGKEITIWYYQVTKCFK